jgi:hypothetical protein
MAAPGEPHPIALGRGWYPRVFPGFVGPQFVDPVCLFTTPFEGSGRYGDLISAAVNVVATATASTGFVPAEKVWWVPYCSLEHDDPALTTHLSINVNDNNVRTVAHSGGADVTAGRKISIRRPLIVPAGWRIDGIAFVAPAAGQNLTLRYAYVELPMGEYVPPL